MMHGASGKHITHKKKLRQSMFFKALREPMERDKTRIYSIMASCLGIDRTDIEAFVAMFEE